MIDWNLAPEGAVELRGLQDGEALKWFNKDGHFFANSKWHKPGFKWQTIATRPTQTKTVKDAVEWSDSKWVHADRDVITYSDEEGFSYSKESYSLDDGEQIVCTYEQFEDYVNEQEFTTTLSECAKESEGILKALAEQEGEKWTHVTSIGKCRVVIDKPDNHGCVVVELEGEGYSVFKPESLKPIKPTISESELLNKIKDMGKGVASDGHFGDTVRGWLDKYDIT